MADRSGSLQKMEDPYEAPPDYLHFWWTVARGVHDHPWTRLTEAETVPTARRTMEERHSDCCALVYRRTNG